MSEPIQSIAQNNYILATQQEVSHDNTLSGNGTVDSPLGLNVSNAWVDVTNEFSATTALTPSHINATYNPYLGIVQLGGSYYCSPTGSVNICNAPPKYKPINILEYKEGNRYYDINNNSSNNVLIVARDGVAQWVSLNLVYACNNTATD